MTQTATESDLTVLKDLARLVEKDLSTRLSQPDLAENLLEAVRYSTLGPGKRLRPALTLMCAHAAGGNHDQALPAASALEMIHCFSLVHDDLPAMDDDDMRRGRPTLHIHAGEAMAILAGDVMVTLAFEFINSADLPAQQRIDLIGELSHATSAMISGQVYDTLGGFPADTDDAQRLLLIHHNKTGALIRAACRLGAISAKADETTLKALTTYGESIGLMFQIVDDLLDVTQSAEHLGQEPD